MSTQETNETARAMGEAALRLARGGECCAEAVVHAAIETLAPDSPKEVAAMMQGLCGGMGNRKATCGVFTGGAVAFGLIANQRGDVVDKKQLKALAARFEGILAQEAGGQICEDILKKMGIRNWNYSQCKKLTGRGAELVAELAIEQGMVTK